MRLMLEIVFWTAATALAWTYAGYPLAVATWATLRRRRVAHAPGSPHLSVVHVARDHDGALEARIREALSADYPEDRLEVVVAPAGALGRLPERIARFNDPRVRLVDSPGRGWAAARNAAASAARGEILVFPDSRALLHPDSFRWLVRNFADPGVGAVCGNRVHLRTLGEDPSLGAERLYADWDKWLASAETRAGSFAAIGRTFWAVRRSLHGSVREGRNPDFAASTAVTTQGFRIVWEPRAICYERGGGAEHRFQRRVRTVRGNFRALSDDPGLLNPLRHGLRAVSLLSRAVLRWMTPVLLLAAGAAALPLAGSSPLYLAAAALMTGWVLLAALGWAARGSRWGRAPWLSIPLFACLGWAAGIVALLTTRTVFPRIPAPPAHAAPTAR